MKKYKKLNFAVKITLKKSRFNKQKLNKKCIKRKFK